MQITFPSNTRETIESIISEIGRDVTFYIPTESGCYNCSLDPVTDTSVNSFCPVCSGTYWIQTFSGANIKSHITWKYADQEQFHTGGHVYLGDGTIKVMYSVAYLDIINSSEYAAVDGKQVDIQKITLLGVPAVNRIILDFKERKKEDDTI